MTNTHYNDSVYYYNNNSVTLIFNLFILILYYVKSYCIKIYISNRIFETKNYY